MSACRWPRCSVTKLAGIRARVAKSKLRAKSPATARSGWEASPQRAPPRNLHPATDLKGELSYEALRDRVNGFRMAVYMQSEYLHDKRALEEERKQRNFDQRNRDRWLISMIRVNLMKRLRGLADHGPGQATKQTHEVEDEIDIPIATDRLSEGQNLQDCDLVVNYDIHWNPVRIMQPLDRIDRIGSVNRKVQMVNFWPTRDLERYLGLKNLTRH